LAVVTGPPLAAAAAKIRSTSSSEIVISPGSEAREKIRLPSPSSS